MSDAQFPVFDKSGKYLYFTASTNLGLSGWRRRRQPLGLSTSHQQQRFTSWCCERNLPSPLAPESDDEKTAEAGRGKTPAAPARQGRKEGRQERRKGGCRRPRRTKKPAEKEKNRRRVTIDFETNRPANPRPYPFQRANYSGLLAGKEGMLFLAEIPEVPDITQSAAHHALSVSISPRERSRSSSKVIAGGGRLRFWREDSVQAGGPGGFITGNAGRRPKPGEGAIRLEGLQVWVEPRARMEADVSRGMAGSSATFLYDPQRAWTETSRKAEGALRGATWISWISRARPELSDGGNAGRANAWARVHQWRKSLPDVKKTKTGLLGADYTIENGPLSASRVCMTEENWNPGLRAPADPARSPGGSRRISSGGGRAATLRAHRKPLFVFSAKTAGAADRVESRAQSRRPAGSREVYCGPGGGRKRSAAPRLGGKQSPEKWAAATNGRVAYLHVPDYLLGAATTVSIGITFAQTDKDAAIIDRAIQSWRAVGPITSSRNLNRKVPEAGPRARRGGSKSRLPGGLRSTVPKVDDGEPIRRLRAGDAPAVVLPEASTSVR